MYVLLRYDVLPVLYQYPCSLDDTFFQLNGQTTSWLHDCQAPNLLWIQTSAFLAIMHSQTSLLYYYDRLEMGKHNAWNINSVVAPKLVGLNSLSMTTKGQMKPTGNFRGELNGIPGWRDQPKRCPWTKDCIQFSNRPDLLEKMLKKSSMWVSPLGHCWQKHHKLQNKI